MDGAMAVISLFFLKGGGGWALIANANGCPNYIAD